MWADPLCVCEHAGLGPSGVFGDPGMQRIVESPSADDAFKSQEEPPLLSVARRDRLIRRAHA
jgi:hypothetical protein